MVAVRQKNVNRYYPYVHLYLDDLREIEGVLRELGSEDDAIEIESENLTSHCLQEIVDIEANDRFRKLTFTRTQPYVTVDIRKGVPVRVYAADVNNLQVKSAVARIDAILRRCQPAPVFRFLMQPRGAALLLMIAAVGLGVEFVGIHTYNRSLTWIPVFTLPFPLAACVGPFKKVTVVRLVTRSNRPGFFQRNRDGLILGTLFAALGAVVSLAIALDLK